MRSSQELNLLKTQRQSIVHNTSHVWSME